MNQLLNVKHDYYDSNLFIFQQGGANLEVRDSDGNTPLLCAVQAVDKNSQDALELLIEVFFELFIFLFST